MRQSAKWSQPVNRHSQVEKPVKTRVSGLSWSRGTVIANHLDLHQSLVAIFQKVAGLSRINTDHTQQELAAET